MVYLKSFVAVTCCCLPGYVNAFSTSPRASFRPSSTSTSQLRIQTNNKNQEESNENLITVQNIQKGIASLSIAAALSMSTSTFNPQPASAYNDFTDDVDVVTNVVTSLKDSTGDAAATFKAFESISQIITEGTGVGGSINYKGVALDRGYVADEDTAIYNPGLTLLTEGEKTKIVNAVIQNRKDNLVKKTWSQDNEYAYDFLKTKLDPLHMVELRGYLGILPFYGAACYLVALAVQQFARDLFSTAYIVSAVAIFLPIIVLVAKGP